MAVATKSKLAEARERLHALNVARHENVPLIEETRSRIGAAKEALATLEAHAASPQVPLATVTAAISKIPGARAELDRLYAELTELARPELEWTELNRELELTEGQLARSELAQTDVPVRFDTLYAEFEKAANRTAEFAMKLRNIWRDEVEAVYGVNPAAALGRQLPDLRNLGRMSPDREPGTAFCDEVVRFADEIGRARGVRA